MQRNINKHYNVTEGIYREKHCITFKGHINQKLQAGLVTEKRLQSFFLNEHFLWSKKILYLGGSDEKIKEDVDHV
ncbi:MAG: hypothetical protein C4581_13860 [Nitrospiraceae bacterium]|nr:MAG: hypothetical protein C4581_13860 [Nitrospiraceae bacterium]